MENERKGSRPDSVFSKKVRAGKRRTYFFDVKSTRSNDYFLTITESKKRFDDTYERFKIFIYKEDFNKFAETLNESIEHIKKELMPNYDFDAFDHKEEFSSQPFESNPTTGSETASTSTENPEQTPYPDDVPTEMPPPPANNDDDLKW